MSPQCWGDGDRGILDSTDKLIGEFQATDRHESKKKKKKSRFLKSESRVADSTAQHSTAYTERHKGLSVSFL